MNLLFNLCFLFCVSLITSEAAPEIENDVRVPPRWHKPAREAAKPVFWPEIPFLERFLFDILSPPRPRVLLPPVTTPRARIFWRYYFAADRNGTAQVATEKHAAEKTGSSDPSVGSTQNNSPENKLKRHKKDTGTSHSNDHKTSTGTYRLQFAKHDFTLPSNGDKGSEGKQGHKTLVKKNDRKYPRYTLWNKNGLSYYFNKSANGTTLNCYRRFYSYVWTIDWSSLFMHIIVILIFGFVLTTAIIYCQALANAVQVNVKRVKVNPNKLGKSKGLEVYSMC